MTLDSKNYPNKIFQTTILLTVSLFIGFACNKQTPNDKKTDTKISIEKLTNSPAYPEAMLELETAQQSGATESTMSFNFNVENYELGKVTTSSNTKVLANSDKGQHIHLILNNKPYSAHYISNFEKNIPNGTHHLVAFLSRSYHESVKNENSVVAQQLIVGDQEADTSKFNIQAPTLIYSRPKGKYAGAAAKRILLDFFVLNTKLSAQGNKVKATINNQEFLLSEWVPYTISGLPYGENSIQLELVDATGKLIEGPFNKVLRTITLEK